MLPGFDHTVSYDTSYPTHGTVPVHSVSVPVPSVADSDPDSIGTFVPDSNPTISFLEDSDSTFHIC